MSDYKNHRWRMVERQLIPRGIDNAAVQEAFMNVPRHEFVPQHIRDHAYEDGPLPIGEGQTISQPYMVASMVQSADPGKDIKVLEIGTGSGYQTAILADICGEVYTVERIRELADKAEETLDRLGYGEVQVKVGDGTKGWAEHAPYDAIIVSAGSPDPPPRPLLDQLAEGGRLVVPVQSDGAQILTIYTRHGNEFHKRQKESCSFVPLIGEHGWER